MGTLDRSNQIKKIANPIRDIIDWAFNKNPNLNRPKIELSGILIPCFHELNGRYYHFQLATLTEEYLLEINDRLAQVAQRASWDDVTIRGYYNSENKVIDVEKIILNQNDDLTDNELVLDYLAS